MTTHTDEELAQYLPERRGTKHETATIFARDLHILRIYIEHVAAGMRTERDAVDATIAAVAPLLSDSIVRNATTKYREAHREHWRSLAALPPEQGESVDLGAREVLLYLVNNQRMREGHETFDSFATMLSATHFENAMVSHP